MFRKCIAVLAAAVALSACSSNNNGSGDINVVADPANNTAFVQVIHASPDAPIVDILVDGNVAVADLDFKQSSGLIELPRGTYSVAVRAQLPGDDPTVIGPVDLNFFSDRIYTVLAIDSVASLAADTVSQSTAAVSAGAAELFVYHGANGVGPVDVFVTAPGADLTATAPVGSFDFGGTIGPAEVPAGTYQIRVTPAGTPGTVAFDSGEIDLTDGARLFVTAVPSTVGAASPISLVVADANGAAEIIDVNETAGVRVVHGAADVPAVDVVADGAVIVPNIEYPSVNGPLQVEPREYIIEVATEGDYPAGVAIGPAPLTFSGSTTTTVVATGTLAADNLGVIEANDSTRPVALYAKLRVIHGASTAPAVDVYLTPRGTPIAGTMPAIQNLTYTQNPGFVPVAAGQYDVTVTLAGTDTVAIPATPLDVDDGGVYTAIARDPLPGSMDFGIIAFAE